MPRAPQQLYSHGDDVTLANPLGPPFRGWSAVCTRLEEAASTLRADQQLLFERVSQLVCDHLAFTLDLEHYRSVRVAGRAELSNFDLRVTTGFRRESGWLAHRPPPRRPDHDGTTGRLRRDRVTLRPHRRHFASGVV
jgi:hypothetical protein